MSRLAVYALSLGLIIGPGTAFAAEHARGAHFETVGRGPQMPHGRSPFYAPQRGRPAPYYPQGGAQRGAYFGAPQRPAEPARNGGPPPGTAPPAAPAHNLSVGDAAQRAQQMNGGGRVLAVDPSEGGGYKVRMLKDGEVRSVYVPGNN